MSAIRAASIAAWKQSDGDDAAITGTGDSPLRPNNTIKRSPCSGFVGMPVDGPARCTSMITSGSSSVTASPTVSDLSTTPGLEHRVGGLEKANITGSISYDPENHDLMTQLRAQKVAGVQVPALEVDHQEGADVLVLSWGGTYGPVHAGVRQVRAAGGKAAHAHLRWLNPFPANLGDVLRSYERVLIPEMNLGQLLQLVRAEFLVDAVGFNQVRGLPLRAVDLADAMEALL